jgi:hypothetical protein
MKVNRRYKIDVKTIDLRRQTEERNGWKLHGGEAILSVRGD